MAVFLSQTDLGSCTWHKIYCCYIGAFPFSCAVVAQCQESYLIPRSAGLGCSRESLYHGGGKHKVPSSLQALAAQGKDSSMCRNREF